MKKFNVYNGDSFVKQVFATDEKSAVSLVKNETINGRKIYDDVVLRATKSFPGDIPSMRERKKIASRSGVYY